MFLHGELWLLYVVRSRFTLYSEIMNIYAHYTQDDCTNRQFIIDPDRIFFFFNFKYVKQNDDQNWSEV